VRGDAQAPDRRGGTLGTSGHVTAKSSIRALGVRYTSGIHARNVLCLTLGDRHAVRTRGHAQGELSEGSPAPIGMQKSAEGIVGAPRACQRRERLAGGRTGGWTEAAHPGSSSSGPVRSNGVKHRLAHLEGALR